MSFERKAMDDRRDEEEIIWIVCDIGDVACGEIVTPEGS